MAPEIKRSGTVTFLVTDIVGSTEALERLGDEAVVAMNLATLGSLGEIAASHGGEVVKDMGDGIMAVFGSAADAVGAAVSMQQSLTNPPGGEDAERLYVRIGLHTGEPLRSANDYYGLPVNIAFRVCHAADGRRIAVSDVVHGLVANRGELIFQDLGEHMFAGLRTPMRIWELVWEAGKGAAAKPAHEPRRTPKERAPDAVVILYADIVDSVPFTERIGDAAFRERARDLDALLRANVREHRGAAVDGKLVGDGILATFPSGRDAIACALECGALSESVELELHLGLHAGDVIRDGNNIYGGAVNLAARIGMATKPGEILLSETVRGLARTSAGVQFEDRGEYMLKGIDEPQRLYTLRA